MALNFNGTAMQAVVYNGTDMTRIVYNNSILWCKPYTLTYTLGTGVASATITRTTTYEPSALTGTLASGSTIYYSDALSVSATASSGYTMNSYTTSYSSVTGDISIAFTANSSFSNPVITSFTTSYISAPALAKGYYLNWTISNPNAFSVTATLTFTGGYSGSSTATIAANSSVTDSLRFSTVRPTTGTTFYLAVYFTYNGAQSGTTSATAVY